jgi:hypothetical protein
LRRQPSRLIEGVIVLQALGRAVLVRSRHAFFGGVPVDKPFFFIGFMIHLRVFLNALGYRSCLHGPGLVEPSAWGKAQ